MKAIVKKEAAHFTPAKFCGLVSSSVCRVLCLFFEDGFYLWEVVVWVGLFVGRGDFVEVWGFLVVAVLVCLGFCGS